jgi:hypothetical protein
MAGNEIETIKYLFLRKDKIILNHLGELKNIGAPEKDGSITNVNTYDEISLISTENSSKKADVYLNNKGISFKQKGASFPFNRLQRAELLKVFEFLKFENPEDQLDSVDKVVDDFHNGKLATRARPWKELFTEEQFKALTKFLMMDGSPNLGISNNKAEFILTSPKTIKNDNDIDVYTFDEYFETFKNDLTFSIRRVWLGQSSNSEHSRAKGLVKKPGNQEWIYETISGQPGVSKTTGKRWRDEIPEIDRRTGYIIFVEKVLTNKKTLL